MANAVLISIRPEWVEKIARGEKTVEVRKTRPKLETPFKCYIYRTKGTIPHIINGEWVQMEVGGTIIAEFTCDRIDEYDDDTISSYQHEDYARWNDFDLDRACMNPEDFQNYANGKWLYGWHISNLKIYDVPLELMAFRKPELPTGLRYEEDAIKRPPQSWCYVEEQ